MTSFRTIVVLLATAAVSSVAGAPRNLPIERIKLPPGFRLDVYAEDVPNARSMARGDKGTLFVGTRAAGKLYAVRDRDGDSRADEVRVPASGMNVPNGVAFRDGALYVAEINRVLRFDRAEEHASLPKPAVVNEGF